MKPCRSITEVLLMHEGTRLMLFGIHELFQMNLIGLLRFWNILPGSLIRQFLRSLNHDICDISKVSGTAPFFSDLALPGQNSCLCVLRFIFTYCSKLKSTTLWLPIIA
jgi:hypothetical protein